jgi:multidrug resistance efflux pump
VLAVIRSPELDQQVSRARAALAQAQANWQLAAAKAQRSGTLVRDGWVSRQNWDNDRLTEGARRADLDAASATLAETAGVDDRSTTGKASPTLTERTRCPKSTLRMYH